MYLHNEILGATASFSRMQEGWREATQEDIDAFLLKRNQKNKFEELSFLLLECQKTGIEYKGAWSCPEWLPAVEYNKSALTQVNGTHYESLQSGNIGNDPLSSPEFWVPFKPRFSLTSDYMTNLTVKSGLNGASNRFKFYTKSDENGYKHLIDFADLANWDSFVLAMRSEHNRVMEKYCEYKSAIAGCMSFEELEEIILDFNA